MRPLLPQRRSTFRLRWPNEVTTDQLAAAWASLNGYSTRRRTEPIVALAVGTNHHVSHYLTVPKKRREGVRHQMETAITGLTVEPVDGPPVLAVARCWRAWFNTRERPLDTSTPEAMARGLLAALASAGDDELLVIRWVLGPVHRPVAVRRRPKVHNDAGLGLPPWALEAAGPRGLDDPERRTALADKQGRAGWRAAVHLGVVASGRRRQRQLLGQVSGAIRTAQGPGAQIGFRPAARSALDRLPTRRPLLVNVAELAGLAGWPLGETEDLPVDRERSRLLPPPKGASTAGRVVAEATYPGAKAPLILSAADALRHCHVLGPTGVGKTTLLCNLVVQDMAAGRSVVVIDPRGDLVAEILARVPDPRLDDVVVLDPTEAAPVGINPLATPGVPGELRVEHLLTIFKAIWADSWGPRMEYHLTAGLLTLTATGGMSLAALPVLFSDPQFRASIVEPVRDDPVLGPFWEEFEQHSPQKRATITAPVLNKVGAFMLRERLRRVVAQLNPRFDLRDIYRRRVVLLVNLATGEIGAESSALLGSLLVSQLWQTILGRAAVPPERRHPVMVVIDEFQRYLNFSTDISQILAEARGLGVGLVLAHQHLAQLTPTVRAATLANARSKVVFQTLHDDAQALVRNSTRLAPADVVGLGRYAIYASLMADNESTPWASGQTLQAPPPQRPADEARQRSSQRWGVPAGVIDAELALLTTNTTPPSPPGDETRLGDIPLDPEARP